MGKEGSVELREEGEGEGWRWMVVMPHGDVRRRRAWEEIGLAFLLKAGLARHSKGKV